MNANAYIRLSRVAQSMVDTGVASGVDPRDVARGVGASSGIVAELNRYMGGGGGGRPWQPGAMGGGNVGASRAMASVAPQPWQTGAMGGGNVAASRAYAAATGGAQPWQTAAPNVRIQNAPAAQPWQEGASFGGLVSESKRLAAAEADASKGLTRFALTTAYVASSMTRSVGSAAGGAVGGMIARGMGLGPYGMLAGMTLGSTAGEMGEAGILNGVAAAGLVNPGGKARNDRAYRDMVAAYGRKWIGVQEAFTKLYRGTADWLVGGGAGSSVGLAPDPSLGTTYGDVMEFQHAFTKGVVGQVGGQQKMEESSFWAGGRGMMTTLFGRGLAGKVVDDFNALRNQKNGLPSQPGHAQ